jgi:hypothetical protein
MKTHNNVMFLTLIFSLIIFTQSTIQPNSQKMTMRKPSFITPEPNSELMLGTTFPIKWDNAGHSEMGLLLCQDNQKIGIIKKKMTAAETSLTWDVGYTKSKKVGVGHHYHFRLLYRVGGKIDHVDSAWFSIVKPGLIKADPIVITEPHHKTSWEAGKRAYIKWRTYGLGQNPEMRIFLLQTDEKTVVSELGRDSDGIFRWDIPETLGGDYKIRVSKASQGSGMNQRMVKEQIFDISPKFHITPVPRTVELQVKPDILNRYSRKQEQYTLEKTDPLDVKYKNKAGLARVGFHNTYYTHISEWIVNMFLFRSRLLFDLKFLKKKRVIILEATLQLDTKENVGNVEPKYAADKLYVLTKPWVKSRCKCYETPGYFYKPVPQHHNARIDIRDQVKDWLSGAEHNYGFLLSGPVGPYMGLQKNRNFRVTYFLPTLFLKYREYPE